MSLVASKRDGHSNETAGEKSEEGGDDVKSSCPLCLGLHTYYNGYYRRQRNRKERAAEGGVDDWG